MREPKFRAYRKEYGMTEPFTLGSLQNNDEFEFTNGGYLSWDEFGLERLDTVLMLYTGLHDKNGVEQCHHDNVRRHNIVDKLGAAPYDLLGTIVWVKGDCGFRVWFPDIEQMLALSPEDEVVGNIHEGV